MRTPAVTKVYVVRCPHCGATESASRYTGCVAFMPPGAYGWVSLLICTICDSNWFMGSDGMDGWTEPVKWEGDHAPASDIPALSAPPHHRVTSGVHTVTRCGIEFL